MTLISLFTRYVIIQTLLFAAAVTQAASSADIVQAALNNSERPSEDMLDDSRRMPLEVLAFAGIEEGMTILEMEAGTGYYTEILSRTVGSDGSVIMQNPPAFDSFFGEAVGARLANNRLSNVTLSRVNFDQLEANDNSVDMVTWILGPHELGFEPGGQSVGNPERAFEDIARVLKPGGVFLAVDHKAAEGSDIAVGGTLHRISESLVMSLANGAGLSMERSSDLHANSNDSLEAGVFDPSIQGQTDKFVLLFRKQ
ncbi:MAG: hypothetical protein CMQ25_01515 [Gammaproteobacteria bacterium]|nr:hypothetical protein [Gammaproteobacteria bacterium]MBR14914.1 hypothetical protein [Gammaproteobacteria bacterium]|tara:strand:+ start:38 stop:802 length:765 start_codon:yes stop_codon:yes gene_type:complete